MKKMMMICLFLLGITAVSRAQGGRITVEERVKLMKENLKLTDDQVTKITALYQAQAKSVDSLRKADGDRKALRPIMRATNDKVRALLTDEQAAAYQKLLEERMSRRQNGGGSDPSNK